MWEKKARDTHTATFRSAFNISFSFSLHQEIAIASVCPRKVETRMI